MRPCLRSHDQRHRSSTTPIGGITPDQLQQLRGISPSSSAVSNLRNTGKLSPLLSRARLDKHPLAIQRRSITEEPMTSLPTRQMSLPINQLLAGDTLHAEARFVPDSPLPKLLFWLQIYKNLQKTCISSCEFIMQILTKDI